MTKKVEVSTTLFKMQIPDIDTLLPMPRMDLERELSASAIAAQFCNAPNITAEIAAQRKIVEDSCKMLACPTSDEQDREYFSKKRDAANAKIEALQKQAPQADDPATQKALRARPLVCMNNLDHHTANLKTSRCLGQEKASKRVKELVQDCDLAVAQILQLKEQLTQRETQVSAAHESYHTKRDLAHAGARALLQERRDAIPLQPGEGDAVPLPESDGEEMDVQPNAAHTPKPDPYAEMDRKPVATFAIGDIPPCDKPLDFSQYHALSRIRMLADEADISGVCLTYELLGVQYEQLVTLVGTKIAKAFYPESPPPHTAYIPTAFIRVLERTLSMAERAVLTDPQLLAAVKIPIDPTSEVDGTAPEEVTPPTDLAAPALQAETFANRIAKAARRTRSSPYI